MVEAGAILAIQWRPFALCVTQTFSLGALVFLEVVESILAGSK